MKRVSREEVRKPAEYAVIREEFRRSVLGQKDERRIHVGENITVEADIHHEIVTYNELLGERGELGCTLLIEIDDPAKRTELLAQWKDLPATLYMETQNGTRVPAQFDPRQVGADRISSVHYLKFRPGDQVPKKVGCSHPGIAAEATGTVDGLRSVRRGCALNY